MVLRWWANRDGKTIVGTLPDSPDMQHQIRREAQAGVLALEAASTELDLTEAVVIMHNDALGALSAFRKGSFLLHISPAVRHALLPPGAPVGL